MVVCLQANLTLWANAVTIGRIYNILRPIPNLCLVLPANALIHPARKEYYPLVLLAPRTMPVCHDVRVWPYGLALSLLPHMCMLFFLSPRYKWHDTGGLLAIRRSYQLTFSFCPQPSLQRRRVDRLRLESTRASRLLTSHVKLAALAWGCEWHASW
jgi:hypothetical protein